MIRLLTNKGLFTLTPGYLSVLLKVDHFDILGVSRNYNVNKLTLENTYKDMQKIIHPDKFSGQTTEVKECSEFLSSYINEAYSTLKDDYERSLYMLLLEGVEVEEDDKLTNPKHLEYIMELNEKIDEGTSELMALKEDVRDKIEEIKYDFNEAIENKELDKAKEKCILLSYYMKANDAIFQKINDA
jgi:molecular chaperone HscB